MAAEIQTYLIGLVPSITLIVGVLSVAIKLFTTVKKIVKRDNGTQNQVNEIINKLDKVLEENKAIRKENLALRRQNMKLMSKITNVYIEDKGE